MVGAKDNYSLFVGAMTAGFLGVSCLSALKNLPKLIVTVPWELSYPHFTQLAFACLHESKSRIL